MAGLRLDPLGTTRQLVLHHGKAVRIDLGLNIRRLVFFHVAGAPFIEQIFRNVDVFLNGGIISRGYTGSLHNILRKGYFSANGKEYENYLPLLAPLFKRSVVDEAGPTIMRVVQEELDGWPVGVPTNATRAINRLVKRLACEAIFKDTDLAAGRHAADMVERHGRLSGLGLRSDIEAKFGRTPWSALHNQAHRTYDALLDWGQTRRGMAQDTDILSAIVNAPTETGCPASPARIAGYAWSMLGAAYDTSTSILSWLLVLLATHPDVAARLHDDITKAGFDVTTDLQRLMDLPYLDHVVKEALRLIPPAPTQRRKARLDTVIGGVPIRAGDAVLISAWMANRDPDLYPDPDRFDPNRWARITRSPFEWLTFSAGPRRCLGIWFAMAILKASIANILLRWRPDLRDGSRVDLQVAVTVRPKPDVELILQPQDREFRGARVRGSVCRHIRFPQSRSVVWTADRLPRSGHRAA